ncbi:conjugative transposon protein TraM [Chitinophaga defluvii]|uniref:Conjugative transposon protein TraM n=1 Tax=Chitinophaga defluvii TaxID=3163343 RepID=A0ABV2T8U1_9BACT
MDSEKEKVSQRKTKILILAPLVIIPLLGVLFYLALGGKKQESNKPTGLNPNLPSPLLNDKRMDKLSLYQEADLDSAKRENADRYDPLAQWFGTGHRTVDSQKMKMSAGSERSSQQAATSGGGIRPIVSSPAPEAKVETKLAEIEKLLSTTGGDSPVVAQSQLPDTSAAAAIRQLEELMGQMNQDGAAAYQEDGEMKQMSNMLETILDIQHPSRVTERIKQQSADNKGKVFPLTTAPESATLDLMSPSPTIKDTGRMEMLLAKHGIKSPVATSIDGFYELDEHEGLSQGNTLAAVIHQDQTITSGATVKLRLLQDAYIQGQLFPKGSFVYGPCNLSGERLQIEIPSVRLSNNALFSVSLTVYDLDGLPGIRIPGSIKQEAGKESSEQAMQALSLGSLDPSLGAQATAAGIDAAKNLLKRKIKLVKVHLKADYPVLLASDQR